MMTAPPKPFAFISPRSRVIASLVTLPLSHHQYARSRAPGGGFFQPLSSESCSSAGVWIVEAPTRVMKRRSFFIKRNKCVLVLELNIVGSEGRLSFQWNKCAKGDSFGVSSYNSFRWLFM